jgi:hypothetical protein
MILQLLCSCRYCPTNIPQMNSVLQVIIISHQTCLFTSRLSIEHRLSSKHRPAYIISAQTTVETLRFHRCSPLLNYPFPRDPVCRVIASKRVWYIHPSRSHCVATAVSQAPQILLYAIMPQFCQLSLTRHTV